MGTVTNTQGKGANVGQAQQNRRAVLIVEDDAELRGFAARLLEDGELDTIECPREGQLPLGVDFMPKPWQPLNLLVAAKQALASL
jgi:hypothetical protein